MIEGSGDPSIQASQVGDNDSVFIIAPGGEVAIRDLTIKNAPRAISLGEGSAGAVLTVEGVTITTDIHYASCVDSAKEVYEGTRVIFTNSQCYAMRPFILVGTSPDTSISILDSHIAGDDEIRLHLEEVEVAGNSFKGTTYIWINNAEKAIFEDNKGTDGFKALYIESARKTSIRNNVIITDNLDEFEANGQWVQDGDKYLLMENNIIQCIGSENGGVYIENYDSAGSIVLIRNNTIQNCNYFYVKNSINTLIKGNEITDTGSKSIEFDGVQHSLITRNLVSIGASEKGYSPISITGGNNNLVADNTYRTQRGVYNIGDITDSTRPKRMIRIPSEDLEVIEHGYKAIYDMVLVVALIAEAVLFPLLTMSIRGTPEFIPLNLYQKKK